MKSETRPADAEIVADILDRVIRDAERAGVAAGVLRELHKHLDLACDTAARSRAGWQ